MREGVALASLQRELMMRSFRSLRRGIVWTAFTMGSAAAIVTARHILATPQPIETALPGERRVARRQEGDIFYNVAGPADARPIVLLHDLHAGASNYTFRHLFPRLAVDFRVYAPDWLGFGLSERPALAYTGEYFAHVLGAFLRETVQAPAVVVAQGLAANLAVRAASDDPALFDRLILIAPHTDAGAETAPSAVQTLLRLAERTALGMVPYAVLATRSALRWRLRQARGDRRSHALSDDAVDHAFASAHQFGGQYAALAVETGELDLPMHNTFALLEPPVLVIGGALDAKYPPQSLQDLTLLRPGAREEIVTNTGGGVAEDQPAAVAEIITRWLAAPEPRRPPFPLMTPAETDSSSDAAPDTGDGAPSPVAPDAAPPDEAANGIAAGVETSSDVRMVLEPEDDDPPRANAGPEHPTAMQTEEPTDTPEPGAAHA
jgi:pimeloyl-ACP methyl ester carboxylesterase